MAKWKEMTKSERRVAVAKDVINQLYANKFIVETGIYFQVRNEKLEDKYYYANPETNQKDIQCLLSKGTKVCYVCARGAMMVSKIDKFNNSHIEFFGSSSSTTEALKDCFTEKQLLLIEACFERTSSFLNKYDKEIREFYENWGPNNPEDRLMCIMQNIIDHKGVFKPKVKYEVV